MLIGQLRKGQLVDSMGKYKHQATREVKNLSSVLQRGKKSKTGIAHLGSKLKQRRRMSSTFEYLVLKAGANSVLRD